MINEHDVCRAAAQRLDAHSAGTGECVEHRCVSTRLSQDVEKRLAKRSDVGAARPGRRRAAGVPSACRRRSACGGATRDPLSRRSALSDLDEPEALAPRVGGDRRGGPSVGGLGQPRSAASPRSHHQRRGRAADRRAEVPAGPTAACPRYRPKPRSSRSFSAIAKPSLVSVSTCSARGPDRCSGY